MEINEVSESIEMTKINFDRALEIFLDKFLELHPKDMWPTWFKSCTTYGGAQDKDNSWRFAFTALPKDMLAENESWEFTSEGKAVLVKIDKETGDKKYVISNTNENVLTIFEAVIDSNTAEVIVVVDKELSEIQGEDLLPLRK